jgi:choline-sulfatase
MKKILPVFFLLFFSNAYFAQNPNVVLITMDTTRADHIGCYGGKNSETPNLDALASKGVLFEEARSSVPLTLPSHATMLTGKLPSTLNLRVNGLVLNDKFPMIQETFRKQGYRTVAVVSAVILEKSRGLSRGFDVYNDKMTMLPKGGGPPEERRAEETTTAALAEAANIRGPYFMWVHYYDPHFEYMPPSPYSEKFSKTPYDGEIAYMDSEIGRLLRGLAEKGLLKNTLIVVAGDHGEGLMEHNERQHGVFLYEYALHVPLIMVQEGKIPAGKKVGNMCELPDIAPTILALTGFQGGVFDGINLAPLFDGKGGKWEERSMYIESYHGYFNYGWAPLRGIMDKEYKFIDAPRPELYRYRASEEKNIYAEQPETASKMRKMLRNYPGADEGEIKNLETFLKDPSNAENLRQLMSLGYLSGPGMRPDQAGMIDPKDGIPIEDGLHKAQELRDSGSIKEAKDMLAEIIKKNPTNFPALSILGGIYLAENKLDEAKICFQEEVKLKPQLDGAHLNLGTVYKKQGDPVLAEKEYRAALTVNPRMTEAVASLSQMLIDQKRFKDAKELLETAMNNQAESADVYFEAGLLYAMESNLERARFCFTKSISLNPMDDQALANLGQIAVINSRWDEAIGFYERATRIRANRADYYATLGSIYLNGKNDPDKAIFYFRKALAVDPYGKMSRDLKEMINGLEREKNNKAN